MKPAYYNEVAVSSAVPATEGTEEGEHIFSRVGVLRGAGNAIVPQVAAAFICAAGVAWSAEQPEFQKEEA